MNSRVMAAGGVGVLTVAVGKATAVSIARMERRYVGGNSAMSREAGRLPVDRLEAILE